MLGVPLGPLGATLPHCVALQDTLQVTPIADVSPVTFAWKGAVQVASTELVPAETETTMDEGGFITGELLPPQPLMIAAETSTRKRAKDAIRFICASETPIGDERARSKNCWIARYNF